MSLALVSFDLDGTLADTAQEIAEAVNLTLKAQALPPRPVAEIVKLIGAGTHELMRRVLERLRREEPASMAGIDEGQVLRSLDVHYAATVGTSARVYPGAHEALAALHAAGVRLACVTNKEQHHAVRVLQALGLHRSFELVVGGDSLPQKKPDGRVLQHVARVLGSAPAHAAHVRDSRIDVEAARQAGYAAWAVPYGYNGGEPIENAQPDRLFTDLASVARHALEITP
ncbi:MAG TPA: phosphoglycolate phosphatase [Burkholderiaceae bacterium]|nr:phosphoglycolate phosphatase [Burkholderiaceae bacterium]